MMNDGEAISLCLKKRPEGYRALFERYSPFLLAVAFRMLKDRHLAEDALQETFSAAFAGLSRFRGEARLKTWLYTILYRAFSSSVKSEKWKSRPTNFLRQATLGTPIPWKRALL